MCGIAGIITADRDVARSALKRMVGAQVHRGPDDTGEIVIPFANGWLGLGHRRLSILDLSPSGHQPMRHPKTPDQIIFNGQIYNYLRLRRELEALGERFHGRSDTEVLLHALSRWGTECFDKLEGMYALAFFDNRRQQLSLARDPLGIKPLYVASTAKAFLFASEIRAILASTLLSEDLDPQGIASLLAYGMPQEPRTFFKNVRAFPAGCWQIVNPDVIQKRLVSSPTHYWKFPSVRKDISEAEAVFNVKETLDTAVRDHLISDVPLGVFLSSGLDSTVIAGLAAKHAPDTRTFTVGFPDDADMSESLLARETAQHLGLRHTEISINGLEAEAAVSTWISALDQPSMDGLNAYVISKAVRKEEIVVALSGQGGDELFGGYPSFADVPRLKRVMRGLNRLPRSWRDALTALSTWGRSHAVKQKARDITHTGDNLVALYLQRRRVMSDTQLAELGIDSGFETNEYLPTEVLAGIAPDDQDAIWLVSQLETRFYLGNTLLHVSDVSGMANSLEIRVPMLDTRMLDLVLALPGSIRLPSKKPDKHLLKSAFPDLLRPSLTKQGKRGFVLPVARWMNGPLREMCEDALDYLKTHGPLCPEGVDAIWGRFRREPESPIWSRAWTLCVFGSYLKHQMKRPGALPEPSSNR